MKPTEILTIAGACLALFWTIVQIVAHARGQDFKNIKIALLIFTVLMIGGGAAYYHLSTAVSPAAAKPKPAEVTEESAGPPPSENAPRIPEDPSDAASPEPTDPGKDDPGEAERPPAAENAADTESLTVSAQPDIAKNVLGGISKVGIRCSLDNRYEEKISVISYDVWIRWTDGEENFSSRWENQPEKIIVLGPFSRKEEMIYPGKEIGDAILRARKAQSGVLEILWTAVDGRGKTFHARSVSDISEPADRRQE